MKDSLTENCAILTAGQMREADRHTIEVEGITAETLMERAGRAVADAAVRSVTDGGRVVVVTGAGNNAGDGFVAARILRNRRIPVTAIPLVPLEKLQPEAARQAELAREAGVKVRPAVGADDLSYLADWLNRSAIVIDAIFGTGLARPVEGWFAEAIDCINRCDRTVLSVDIASGLNADSGNLLGCAVKADFTLPIAAYKWGHWLRDGRLFSGKLHRPAQIGITEATLERMMRELPVAATGSHIINRRTIRESFPTRRFDAHKSDFGHLWIFGGSKGYTGAPRLAASGALAVGTGLVSIACPDDVYEIVAASSLEVMVHPQERANLEKASAVVAGPGWGVGQSFMLERLLESDKPLILDADALNMIASDVSLVELVTNRKAFTLLTPHPGEAGRLLGRSAAEVQEDRLGAAVELAQRYTCRVVLKGAGTLVVDPDSRVALCPFGSPNLAVAGTGDVLAGMIGGLLARGVNPSIAVQAAVALHAIAGEQDGWHRAGQMEDIVVSTVRQIVRAAAGIE